MTGVKTTFWQVQAQENCKILHLLHLHLLRQMTIGSIFL